MSLEVFYNMLMELNLEYEDEFPNAPDKPLDFEITKRRIVEGSKGSLLNLIKEGDNDFSSNTNEFIQGKGKLLIKTGYGTFFDCEEVKKIGRVKIEKGKIIESGQRTVYNAILADYGGQRHVLVTFSNEDGTGYKVMKHYKKSLFGVGSLREIH